MPLSRRQFFGSFWKPQKTLAKRQEQYRIMKSYVGAILIPFDFSLTPEQTSEVFETADVALKAASDEDLFSDTIRIQLDRLIEPKIKTWYEQLLKWVQGVRLAASDHVPAFLNYEATPEQIKALQLRCAIQDPGDLEEELKKQIRTWAEGLDNEHLRRYDALTVKDRVFAELRSWC